MAYQVINEQYGIMGCSVDDLTEEQTRILKTQRQRSKIRDLTLFYDQDEQKFIMNLDHSAYEHYFELLMTYMEFSEGQREYFKECLSKKRGFKVTPWISSCNRYWVSES